MYILKNYSAFNLIRILNILRDKELRFMNKLVSIIILNYNRNNNTLECLNSLQKQTYNHFEIILVDNGSKHSTYLELKKSIEKFENRLNISFIRETTNLFFTGGNNKALKIARGSYLCLLNDDTIVNPDFIERMVNFFEQNPDAGMISPKIKVYKDKNYLWYAGVDINLRQPNVSKLRGIWEFDPQNKKYNEIVQTDYAAGTALFLKKEVLDKIGLLDEIFFMYFEETDWNIRAKKKGYKIYYVPTAIIYHKVSPPIRDEPSILKQFFLNRNAQILVWKHANSIDLLIFYLKFLLRNLRQILKALLSRELFEAYLQFHSLIRGFKIGIKRKTNRNCRKYLLNDYHFIKRVENKIKSLR